MGGKQRVAAEREEIIMDADLFALKDIRPDSGEHILERRARSNEGLRRGDAAGEPQLRRQADTLHFASWTFSAAL